MMPSEGLSKILQAKGNECVTLWLTNEFFCYDPDLIEVRF